jgi:hypothetical protein
MRRRVHKPRLYRDSRPDELRSVRRLGVLRVIFQIASAPTVFGAFQGASAAEGCANNANPRGIQEVVKE